MGREGDRPRHREYVMINTLNDFLLNTNGQQMGPMLPMVITSREQAYRTAAWIKAMAIVLPPGEDEHSFEEIEEAIRNT